MANDLGKLRPKADISVIFDMITDGPVTDIARDKDKMLGEAIWNDHLRKTRQKPPDRRPPRGASKRRNANSRHS